MALLHQKCSTCGKSAIIQAEIPLNDNYITYVWKCGHIENRLKDNNLAGNLLNQDIHKEGLNASPPALIPTPVISKFSIEDEKSFESLDHSDILYDFQKDTVDFVEKTNFNCLVAHAMGLGKTPIACVVLKRHIESFSPCLIVVKSATIFQWARHLKHWAVNTPLGVMPVMSRECLIPGFNVYIVSMDFIARKGVLEKLVELGIKSIIVDECQNFKDTDSKRTNALVKLITQLKIMKRIFLSGTPIKNRASEYFTILNLIAPEYFTSPINFKRHWLVQNEKGIYTRINPYRLDAFRKLTSRWIIRKEKHEVLTNLPPLKRNYEFVEIEDEKIKKSYNYQLQLFDNFMKNTANISSQDILGWLAKLRAITGQAKVGPAVEWASEFLDSTEESLAIGIQHRSVRDTLHYVFEAAGYDPLKLSGEDNAYAKDRIVAAFNSGANRLLTINMLAGGVGLNLQSCANALVLERQWNSADEEQFESRFHRNGQQHAVTVTYMLAKGTLDQWFHEMVAAKRKILNETLSNDAFDTSEDANVSQLMKDLVDTTIANKL